MAQNKSRTRSAKKQRQPLKKGREREQQVYFVQSMRWATRDFEDDCTGVQDEELIAAARTGDTEAQYRLGKLYAEGRKVPRDDERALYWFQRAAQPPVPGHEPLYKISYPCTKKVLPSSEATYEVGRAIWHGRGTEMDFGDAYAWWKMADAQGNDHARMALSAYHIPDNPRPMDDATFTCIVQMADAGDMDAQHCLGNCFFLGLGVSKDPAKAMEWWKKAAAQGHEHATYYAGASILQNNFPGSCEEAISLMEQAAGLGLRKAKCLLGNCYLHGDYVQQDPEKAVAYIREHRDGPFFLMVSLTAPHTPIAPTAEFEGRSRAGRYGDFVEEMDHRIGEMLAALRDAGIEERTIVVFSSDNGSSFQDGGTAGGERYGGRFGSILDLGHNPSGRFRGMKSDSWEGGHRIPFLVRWPGVIPAGSVTDALTCDLDLYATLADVAGVTLSEGDAVDSRSLMPLLRGGEPVRTSLVAQSGNGILCYISGDWKLIAGSGSGGSLNPYGQADLLPAYDAASGRWRNVQLYNLASDPEERYDRAALHPQRVARMMEALAGEVRRGGTAADWQQVAWTSRFGE